MVITQHFKGSQIALKRKTDFYILLYFLLLLILDFLLYYNPLFQPAEFDDTIQSTQQQQPSRQALTCVLRVGAAAAAVLQLRGGDFSGEGEFFLTCSPNSLALSLRLFSFLYALLNSLLFCSSLD